MGGALILGGLFVLVTGAAAHNPGAAAVGAAGLVVGMLIRRRR